MTDREQLRERLESKLIWDGYISDHAEAGHAVAAIVAEIEAAGYVVLERSRVARVFAMANAGYDVFCYGEMGYDDAWGAARSAIQPGDMDMPEGGE